MAFGKLQDEHGTVDLVFFPKTWKSLYTKISNHVVVSLKGYINETTHTITYLPGQGISGEFIHNPNPPTYSQEAPGFAKPFRQEMFSNSIMAIEIDRKSLADMFRTFANKDAECKIVINDDGTAKVKLIAGSLSKSYPFELNDDEKNLLANDGWIGFAESKY